MRVRLPPQVVTPPSVGLSCLPGVDGHHHHHPFRPQYPLLLPPPQDPCALLTTTTTHSAPNTPYPSPPPPPQHPFSPPPHPPPHYHHYHHPPTPTWCATSMRSRPPKCPNLTEFTITSRPFLHSSVATCTSCQSKPAGSTSPSPSTPGPAAAQSSPAGFELGTCVPGAVAAACLETAAAGVGPSLLLLLLLLLRCTLKSETRPLLPVAAT